MVIIHILLAVGLTTGGGLRYSAGWGRLFTTAEEANINVDVIVGTYRCLAKMVV